MAWLTAFWAVFSPVAIASHPDPKSNLPVWADASLAMVTFVLLFGVVPAALRLGYRRLRQRQQAVRSGNVSRTAGPTLPPRPYEPSRLPPNPWPSATFDPSNFQPAPTDAPKLSMGSQAPPPGSQRTSVPAPPATAPEPPAASSSRDVEHSEVLRSARSSLQFPIARAAREVQLASDFRQQYEAIIRAAEALTVTLAISIAAAFRATGDSLAPLNALRSAYFERGVSLGHWQAVIKAAAKPIPDRSEPLPGMLEALRLGKGGAGLVPALDELVEERNRWAHGAGPRNNVEAGTRLEQMGRAIEAALAKAMFLHQHPWVLVSSSSYRRGAQQFAITAANVMADHPDFERRHFSSLVPLADDVVYMLTPNGAIDLTPFVVMRDCPECQQSELCYADRVYGSRGLSLKSFARGHIMYDTDLVAELQNLFVSA